MYLNESFYNKNRNFAKEFYIVPLEKDYIFLKNRYVPLKRIGEVRDIAEIKNSYKDTKIFIESYLMRETIEKREVLANITKEQLMTFSYLELENLKRDLFEDGMDPEIIDKVASALLEKERDTEYDWNKTARESMEIINTILRKSNVNFKDLEGVRRNELLEKYIYRDLSLKYPAKNSLSVELHNKRNLTKNK